MDRFKRPEQFLPDCLAEACDSSRNKACKRFLTLGSIPAVQLVAQDKVLVDGNIPSRIVSADEGDISQLRQEHIVAVLGYQSAKDLLYIITQSQRDTLLREVSVPRLLQAHAQQSFRGLFILAGAQFAVHYYREKAQRITKATLLLQRCSELAGDFEQLKEAMAAAQGGFYVAPGQDSPFVIAIKKDLKSTSSEDFAVIENPVVLGMDGLCWAPKARDPVDPPAAKLLEPVLTALEQHVNHVAGDALLSRTLTGPLTPPQQQPHRAATKGALWPVAAAAAVAQQMEETAAAGAGKAPRQAEGAAGAGKAPRQAEEEAAAAVAEHVEETASQQAAKAPQQAEEEAAAAVAEHVEETASQQAGKAPQQAEEEEAGAEKEAPSHIMLAQEFLRRAQELYDAAAQQVKNAEQERQSAVRKRDEARDVLREVEELRQSKKIKVDAAQAELVAAEAKVNALKNALKAAVVLRDQQSQILVDVHKEKP